MVCLEWQDGQCPPAGCPQVNWFWWLVAVLALVALAARKKRIGGRE